MIIKPNPAGIAAITRDDQMRRFMADKAQELENEAKAIAPVATGAFQDSLRGGVELGDDGWKAVLSTDSPYWPYLEFGTSDTPIFATLRRALAGLKV